MLNLVRRKRSENLASHKSLVEMTSLINLTLPVHHNFVTRRIYFLICSQGEKGDPANQNIYMPLRKERKSLAGDAAVTNTAKAESLRRRLAEVRGVY